MPALLDGMLGWDFLCIASFRENHFFLNRDICGIFMRDQILGGAENMRKWRK
jgi:hypothetical protein